MSPFFPSTQRWISAPTTAQRYFSTEDQDAVMLEDDSGRIRLVGDVFKKVLLVTGCIIAVLGVENINGELEVIDIKFPDLAPQPGRWELSKPYTESGARPTKRETKSRDEDVEMTEARAGGNGGKIAIVSGLEFSGADTSYAMELDLLLEYLLGEALDPATQNELSHISRLIVAGNSVSADGKPDVEGGADNKSIKKYGYDSSSYNPVPIQLLDDFLAELLTAMPVTLLPGVMDPANSSYPQQPIHTAMFSKARAFTAVPGSSQPGWFDTATNPWEAEVDGWRVLGTGGQNVEDMAKYVDSDDRLGMMEAMCRWRCSAPTAPDTLCEFCPCPISPLPRLRPLTRWSTGSYPFQDDEPFVMSSCPHLYFVGCQPEFGTKVIQGTDGQAVRVIAVPSFSETREIVLVDTETLDVTKVKISVPG